jgi:hypothetical protein
MGSLRLEIYRCFDRHACVDFHRWLSSTESESRGGIFCFGNGRLVVKGSICNGVRRSGGLRYITSYERVQLYICVCGMRKGGSDSRTQLVAEWISARTKPLQYCITFSLFGPVMSLDHP